MFYETGSRDRSLLPHDPFKALVVPRPVGWVSTMNKAGQVNLAPYSYFNAFCGRPPIVGFSSDGPKDSATFAEETGEFVWNMATYELRFQMSETSAPLPRGESEFPHARLETAPSRLVRPPRVAASPAALECKVVDVIRLKDLDGRTVDNILVLGQVVGVHIDDRYIKDGIVDAAAMQPIARCGYQDYAVVKEMFSIVRPPGGGGLGDISPA
jgi:flavin reductase (DIM6/NTAB) family NADH-FMN oxidoreductase RutF